MQRFDLQQRSKELATHLDDYIKCHFEQLVTQFVDCFSAYCNKICAMQQQGGKEPIAYIHFSVLRTNILLKKHEIRMDAYDENWYMDSVECSAYYPVKEIYSFLESYGEILEELRRKSNGKISVAEAQRRLFSESNIYLFYAAELIRVGLREAVRTEAYQKVKRAPCFIICIGGYLDRFDILYKEDSTVKDSNQIKRRFESRQTMIYSHEICENLNLSKGNYEELEFHYSSFKGCDFTESNWKKGKLLFCSLQNTVFKQTKMEKTKIFDTDFSGARLERVSFAGAKIKHVSFVGATLIQVDFTKAVLAEEIDFRDTRIIDCKLPERR